MLARRTEMKRTTGVYVCACSVNIKMVIQGDLWVMSISVVDNFIGLCDQKFSISMGPVLSDYGAVGVL
jgi:hypothetical protein